MMDRNEITLLIQIKKEKEKIPKELENWCSLINRNVSIQNRLEQADLEVCITVYWKKFLEWEVKYCADEGTINAGSHILVILQKN